MFSLFNSEVQSLPPDPFSPTITNRPPQLPIPAPLQPPSFPLSIYEISGCHLHAVWIPVSKFPVFQAISEVSLDRDLAVLMPELNSSAFSTPDKETGKSPVAIIPPDSPLSMFFAGKVVPVRFHFSVLKPAFKGPVLFPLIIKYLLPLSTVWIPERPKTIPPADWNSCLARFPRHRPGAVFSLGINIPIGKPEGPDLNSLPDSAGKLFHPAPDFMGSVGISFFHYPDRGWFAGKTTARSENEKSKYVDQVFHFASGYHFLPPWWQ